MSTRTLRRGQGSSPRHGIVTGYVWKVIRESVAMTQQELAEELRVDVTTIQAWESGRRSLSAVSSADLAKFRIHLLRRGANPRLFAVLTDAIEADTVFEYVIQNADDHTGSLTHHPLAATVHRRDLTNLLTWPLTGSVPSQLAGLLTARPHRRGPVASHPSIGTEERSRLFSGLLSSAEATGSSPDGSLLRRQATYLLAFDTASRTKEWLASEHAKAVKRAYLVDDVPSWISVRSAAVALAQHGDPGPLDTFIEKATASQDHELANLIYWAYWMGEIPHLQIDDTFMRDDRLPWDGSQLLGHLLERLHPHSGQTSLYVHTLSRLVLARPHLLDRYPDLTRLALNRIEAAAGDQQLTVRARQELSNVAYAIKFSRR